MSPSVGELRLVMLDSSVPGAPYGELEPATLAWLDRTLAAAPDQPALVALHHPPFPVRHPAHGRAELSPTPTRWRMCCGAIIK